MAALKTHVIEGGPGADRLLVALHGHDGSEAAAASLFSLLDPGGRYLVAGIRGPLPCEGGGFAWFELGRRGVDAGSFGAARARLRRTVAELGAAHGIGPERTVVAGFSQGAAMAASAVLASGGVQAAGLILVAGFLVDVDGLVYDWAGGRTRVLVQHGEEDDVVPLELGEDLAATCEANGVPTALQVFPQGHRQSLESLASARDWLARLG